ncbi:ferritin-like domain-containing protein [Talaromyces proteolyticus]|uniref:Ferritin-like domain-containing protein n=1 Tax=Talaromyces proteolyticus TaxID=1131652 RepID=A0AAD4Q4D4_9EURO|nr:ferritin-like domain-containing protein [Talaromyces proteolyticus]KAH8706044.1 ferritin-like domain-containing protein [Talaromyces proteolyticus]
MKLFRYLAITALAGATQASPAKRAVDDATILNYALTLEHLEAAFYATGLKNFTQVDFINAGYADPFYINLQRVASDEAEHVTFLSTALKSAGAPATAACAYAFPVTDVDSFIATANILEGVGVSAYLGAAASIANKAYLTAAGSILTVEARHSSYLRAIAGEVPFAQPFDDPLDLNEVYTLASSFIVSCPSSNPSLPVKAFPSLTVSSTGTLNAGSQVVLATSSNAQAPSKVYAAFVTVTGPVFTTVTPSGGGYSVTIPSGVMGQSYIVLTSSNGTVSDENIVAGPSVIEVGAKNGKPSPTITPSIPSSTGVLPSKTSSIPQFTGAASAIGVSSGVMSAIAVAAAIIFA